MESAPTEEPLAAAAYERPMGPYAGQPDLDELANRMFRQFARFEYALKASRCLIREDGRAEPNWDRFAARVCGSFEARRRADRLFRLAVKYLTGFPPREQVAERGRLKWVAKPADPAVGCAAVLLYVRRVRNNLFHGGKFSRRWIDPERSRRLINASLVILSGCLEMSPPVLEAYEH